MARSLQQRFFAPLGMSSASTSRAGLMGSPSWARPHNGAHPLRPEEVSDAYYRIPAAGGINGSIKDLSIWMLAQMGLAPEVLPQAVLNAVQTPRIRTPGENVRRRKFPRAHRAPRPMGSAGGSSIMPATASSAIMAGCTAIAR